MLSTPNAFRGVGSAMPCRFLQFGHDGYKPCSAIFGTAEARVDNPARRSTTAGRRSLQHLAIAAVLKRSD